MRHGIGADAGGDLGEQRLLPCLALELPGAEPDQDGQAGDRQQGRPKQAGLSQLVEHRARSVETEAPLAGLVLVL